MSGSKTRLEKTRQAAQAHDRGHRARQRRQIAHPAADQEAQPSPEKARPATTATVPVAASPPFVTAPTVAATKI
jgi:hypothetical protein